MSAIPNAQLASEYDEDACIRGRISIIRGRWESAYSTPLTKLLKQLSDKGYSQKNETCTQDIQFFEPTDPAFHSVVIVSSENVACLDMFGFHPGLSTLIYTVSHKLPESTVDSPKIFWLFFVEETETPVEDPSVVCMGEYIMRDMKDKLTVGGWKRLPEKIQNAFIELQLQLSTLREHSGSDDVAPMNKGTTRENYDKGVSQLPLLLFDREGHHPSRQWPEFWTVLQKSQNPRYQQNRQMDRASRAWMPDSC